MKLKLKQDHLEMLPLPLITDNPFQIGFSLDEDDVVRAAYQVRDEGLSFPLLVRPRRGIYELGTGRRWLSACRLLGISKAPVLVMDLDDQTMTALAFEEAAHAGTITMTHGDLLLKSIVHERISGLMKRMPTRITRLRAGITDDPSTLRALPPHPRFRFAAPDVLSSPSQASPEAPKPSPPPQEIRDTFLGLHCRLIPASWFRTVSEPGRRWMIENASSGGRIEIQGAPSGWASASAADEGFRRMLADRFPDGAFSEGQVLERHGLHQFECGLHEADADRHHRFVLLYKAGRAVTFHLRNTERFILYDLQALEDLVGASDFI